MRLLLLAVQMLAERALLRLLPGQWSGFVGSATSASPRAASREARVRRRVVYFLLRVHRPRARARGAERARGARRGRALPARYKPGAPSTRSHGPHARVPACRRALGRRVALS